MHALGSQSDIIGDNENHRWDEAKERTQGHSVHTGMYSTATCEPARSYNHTRLSSRPTTLSSSSVVGFGSKCSTGVGRPARTQTLRACGSCVKSTIPVSQKNICTYASHSSINDLCTPTADEREGSARRRMHCKMEIGLGIGPDEAHARRALVDSRTHREVLRRRLRVPSRREQSVREEDSQRVRNKGSVLRGKETRKLKTSLHEGVEVMNVPGQP